MTRPNKPLPPFVDADAALNALAIDEGFWNDDFETAQAQDLIEEYVLQSMQPGICMDCGFCVSQCESDQDAGWCEGCGSTSVKSVGILSGLI